MAKVTSVLSVDIFYTSVEACERHFFVCVFLIIDIMIPASTNTESEEQSEDQEFHRQTWVIARRGSVTCRTRRRLVKTVACRNEPKPPPS